MPFISRRIFSGDGNGDRCLRGVVDDDQQRSRNAHATANQGVGIVRAPRPFATTHPYSSQRDYHHRGTGVLLLPGNRRIRCTCVDRPVVVCGGRAVRATAVLRALLAALDSSRGDRRTRDGICSLGVHAVSADARPVGTVCDGLYREWLDFANQIGLMKYVSVGDNAFEMYFNAFKAHGLTFFERFDWIVALAQREGVQETILKPFVGKT